MRPPPTSRRRCIYHIGIIRSLLVDLISDTLRDYEHVMFTGLNGYAKWSKMPFPEITGSTT